MTGRHVVRAAGSWLRSKSACSAANASTAGSEPGSASNPRSPPGNDCEMPPRSRIKWMFTIEKARTKMGRTYPCHADTRPKSKSHNHCAGILVEHNSGFVAKYIGDG